MRAAAIDCGTNTIRLLVSETGPAGPVELLRTTEFVGLGAGVDATHRFNDAAVERGFAAVEQYAAQIASFGCERVRFVATSATRDAENRAVFLDGVSERLGITAEVISGETESELRFRGALSGVSVRTDPVLVIDSGGGSTEFVRGCSDGTILQRASVNVGSRRLRERWLLSDPPRPDEVAAARTGVRKLIKGSGIDLAGIGTFIGVAGTITTLMAVVLGLETYDRTRVHGATLRLDQLTEVAERLLRLPVADVRRISVVPPERAKVLCGGALVVEEIGRLVGTAMTVSEADILDGVILGLMDAPS